MLNVDFKEIKDDQIENWKIIGTQLENIGISIEEEALENYKGGNNNA